MSIARSIGVLVLLAAVAASVPAQQPPAPPAPPAPSAPAAPAAPPAPPAPPAVPATPATPAFEVQVKDVEAVHAIVLPMKGSYMQHPDAFAKLGGYLSGHGITPAGPAFGRYFTDLSVGEANLVWEVGLPVAAGVTAEAPYETRDLPAGKYAVHEFKGSMDQIGSAWQSFIGWVMSNGYQPVLPAMQVFKGAPPAMEMELRIGVQK
jgi:effector-binding domain-containing protein